MVVKEKGGDLSVGCSKCKNLHECGCNKMKGVGPAHATFMLIGEAPGADEEIKGIPFVGRAGQFLNKLLYRAEINRSKCYITNVVKCRPPNNRTPTKKEIQTCLPYLEEEIKKIKPKVIVTLGAVAFEAVTGLKKVTRWLERKMYSNEWGCWVVPLYHPAALLRFQSGYENGKFVQGLELASVLIMKEQEVGEYKLIGIKDKEKAKKVLETLLKQKEISFDVETPALDSIEILGFSTAWNEKGAVYVDWSCIKDSRENNDLLEELLAKDEVVKIFHNSQFDMTVLMNNGFKMGLKGFTDTMIASHLIDENMPKGLKGLSWLYTDLGGYEKELERYKLKEKIVSYKDIPFEVMGEYSCYDALATYKLWQIFKKELERIGVMPFFNSIILPARYVMILMCVDGFRVDVKRAEFLSEKISAQLKVIEKKIYKMCGEVFNISSPKQLSEMLFKKLGLVSWKETPKGAPSTDEESLELMVGEHPVVEQIVNIRKLNKVRNTFLDGVLKYVGDDGRVHPTFNMTGTVTGRSSCSDPGIHNVPNDSLVRGIFIPSKGRQLVCLDMKSSELRILAAYCQDKRLIEFLESVDFHTMVAMEVFRKKEEDITAKERSISKAISFGIIYGRGAKSISKELDISLEKAKDIISTYHVRFPNIKPWTNGTVAFVKKNKYVQSLFGRRRRLPGVDSDNIEVVARAYRQAINAPISSASADYLYLTIVRLYKRFEREGLSKKVTFVHTIHDSIVLDVDKDIVERVCKMVEEEVAKPFKLVPIRMRAGVDVERRWGEKKGSELREILKMEEDDEELITHSDVRVGNRN